MPVDRYSNIHEPLSYFGFVNQNGGCKYQDWEDMPYYCGWNDHKEFCLRHRCDGGNEKMEFLWDERQKKITKEYEYHQDNGKLIVLSERIDKEISGWDSVWEHFGTYFVHNANPTPENIGKEVYVFGPRTSERFKHLIAINAVPGCGKWFW